MLNKRITSMALAALTTAALAAPAFAANNTIVNAGFQEIEIAVTVPTTGTVVINPYGLPVKVEKTDGTTKSISGQQITTQPLYITNDGDTNLDIGATVSLVNGKSSGIGYVTQGTPSATDKEALVKLEVKATDVTGSTAESNANTIQDAVIDAYVDSTKWANAGSVTFDSTKAVSSGATALATIKAVTPASGQTPAAYQAGSIAMFRLTGSVTKAPDEAWSTKDSFTATIAFTFTPNTGS
jgi:hypothetical protein